MVMPAYMSATLALALAALVLPQAAALPLPVATGRVVALDGRQARAATHTEQHVDGRQARAASMMVARLRSSLVAASPFFEFSPTRFLHGSFFRESSSMEVGAYIACMVTVAVLLGIAYSNRGVATCVAIIMYVLSLSLMSVLVKNVFAHGFKFPQFVTAFHFLATSTISCLILMYRNGGPMIPNAKTFFCGVAPVAMSTALSIGFANQGLVYCSAHFYEMFNGLTCLVTAGLGLVLGRPIDLQLFLPLLLITMSLLIVSFGELSFSFLAVACLSMGVLFRATKAQLQSLLLSPKSGLQQLAPLDLVMWSCLASFSIMAAWSAVSEGGAPFAAIQEHGAALAVMVSTVPACILNVAALFVLKELGPVAQQAVGALKGVLACSSAVVVFGEVITMQQVAGYSILVTSCLWYNRVDGQLKRQATEAATGEKTPLVGAKQV